MSISADIYELSSYIEELKNKFIEAPEDTLSMGIFGYLSEVQSCILQNSVIMISEYSNEAIPVKAKFEKNIITHALTLGINKIHATPATMEVLLLLPETELLYNMKDDKFVYDKKMKIFIEGIEYHTDYDILINNVKLPSGESVYTAMYDLSAPNPLANTINPYLPPLGRVRITNVNFIAVNCTIRQIEYVKIYRKILTDNPLENKIINFNFDSQLSYFDLDVTERGTVTHLTPIYDGLTDYVEGKYCNYSYLNTNTIRLKFNRLSYEPHVNCDVCINVYTTQGNKGNFSYRENVIIDLQSDRFSYDKLYMVLKPVTDSAYGVDKKSIDELKNIIPKEALSRGSITNYTDLNNFFNSINDNNCKMYFLEKVHNQLDRAYYSYILLKKDDIVIPTNTVDVTVQRQNFNTMKSDKYILDAGNTVYYTKGVEGAVKTTADPAELAVLEKSGFVYITPFMCVVNKHPFYVSYYLNIINITKLLNFSFTNQNSNIQFISTTINWKREFFTDRNTYKLNISLLQNINSDMGLIEKDTSGKITGCNIKIVSVIYDSTGKPARYCFGELVRIDEDSFIYDFEFKINTNNDVDKNSRIMITDMCHVGTTVADGGYFDMNTNMDIYILIKSTVDTDRRGLDLLVPGLDGYTLCNTYKVINGIDLAYNYSNIVSSYVKVEKTSKNTILYEIKKMPLIRKTYIDSEEKMQYFLAELEKRRVYIEHCLSIIEDSFGIDLKFFNTYGPSELFNITIDSNIDKVNLGMTFRAKFTTITDKYIEDFIKADIKAYIENINQISDLHIPNLITFITNKYRQQLVYFEFVDINGYGPGSQHIVRSNVPAAHVVPEFLNINNVGNNTPDINIIIDETQSVI